MKSLIVYADITKPESKINNLYQIISNITRRNNNIKINNMRVLRKTGCHSNHYLYDRKK